MQGRIAEHLMNFAERLADRAWLRHRGSNAVPGVESLIERQTVGAHVAEAGAEVDVTQLVDIARATRNEARVQTGAG